MARARRREGDGQVAEALAAAEAQGLRLALSGRTAVLVVALVLLALVWPWPEAWTGAGVVLLLLALGCLHIWLIASGRERPWHRYLLAACDFSVLATLAATAPLLSSAEIPQHLVFQTFGPTYLFLLVALSALSLSPRYVISVGCLAVATVWVVFFIVTADLTETVSWTDLPEDATEEEFLAVLLNPNYIGTGTRFVESLILLFSALLLAAAVSRARRLVWQRAEAEAKRRRTLEVFGRYVPDTVAARLADGAGALAPQAREATILIADIAGFTKLAEGRPPAELIPVLNDFFALSGEVITDCGGVIVGFLGDGFLAAFNVADDIPDHAGRAITAAQALLAQVGQVRFDGQKLSLRIGIATGPVAAGSVGGRHQAYTVYGDTVNLAQRLEVLNKETGTSLLISEATWQAAGLGPQGRAVGQLLVRGRDAAVSAYTVLTPAGR